jgi:small conductance mechanosensitive channel
MKEQLHKYLSSVEYDVILNNTVRIILIIILAWIFKIILKGILNKWEQRLIKRHQEEGESLTEATKRIHTLMGLVNQATMVCLWIATVVIVLEQLGVEVGPLIAGAGIAGLAVGFGAQNLVRDVISGFFIVLENQVRIGDTAVINGTAGTIEEINFRTLVLRDISGVVHVFPNGTISTIANKTSEWSGYVFDIGIAYKENTDKATEIMRTVLDELHKDNQYGPNIIESPEIFGVNELADSAVVIKGRIKTKPGKQMPTGREFLRRIKLAFDENNIEIPFPQRTLHLDEDSTPIPLKNQS